MEQSPLKLKCIVTFDSPTDTWVSAVDLPADANALLGVIQNLRDRLHFAASLFASPVDVITGLAQLFPVFATPLKGDEPIVHGVRVGDMFVQIELFIEGKESKPTANVVMLADPTPLDSAAPRALYDVCFKLSSGAKVLAKENWVKSPVVNIVAKYFRFIHQHLEPSVIEDCVPALILDPLDLMIGLENGQIYGTDFHINVGSHVLSFTFDAQEINHPVPTPSTPVGFLH